MCETTGCKCQENRFRKMSLNWKLNCAIGDCRSDSAKSVKDSKPVKVVMTPGELKELLELASPKLRDQAERYIISWQLCAFDARGNERLKLLLDGIAKCIAAGDSKTADVFKKVAAIHAAKVANLKKLALQALHEACSVRD